jgi:hypothetical protein
MVVKCAWCGVVETASGSDEMPPEDISHSICSTCDGEVRNTGFGGITSLVEDPESAVARKGGF